MCLRVYLLLGRGRREIALGQQIGSTVGRLISFGRLVISAGGAFTGWASAYVFGITYTSARTGECAGDMCVCYAQVEGRNRPPVAYQVWLNGISARCVLRPRTKETKA